jgi:hypothetical protein
VVARARPQASAATARRLIGPSCGPDRVRSMHLGQLRRIARIDAGGRQVGREPGRRGVRSPWGCLRMPAEVR